LISTYFIFTATLDIFSSNYSINFEADHFVYRNLITIRTIAYYDITAIYKIKTPLCMGHHISLKICTNNNLPIFLSLTELENSRTRSALQYRIKSKTKLPLIVKKYRFLCWRPVLWRRV